MTKLGMDKSFNQLINIGASIFEINLRSGCLTRSSNMFGEKRPDLPTEDREFFKP